MKTDPYMVGEDASDEDISDSDVSDSPKKRRRRTDNFSNQEGPVDGPSAELQLEAMLAAEGQPPPGAGGKGGGGPPGAADAMSGKAPLEPRPGMQGQTMNVETTPMDFSRIVQNQPTREMPVPKNLVEHLMTSEHRALLIEESGADAEWAPDEHVVKLRGSTDQVKRAMRLLQRVVMHCHWGRSEAKVSRLLKPKIVESAIVRLSPMNTLRPFEKTLSNANTVLCIGKDKTNDLVLQDPIISRQHCVLELDMERGAIYAIDCSTNGTFLNDVRLPAKTVGKVLVSHGDELLFRDPASGDREFGYVVTLYEFHVKEHVKLEAPRRLLTSEELASTNRDFG